MLAKAVQNAFCDGKVAVSFMRALENDRDLCFFCQFLI